MKPLDNKNKSITATLFAYNGEVGIFNEEFVFKGSLVEIYLGEFEEKMRKILAEILIEAYGTSKFQYRNWKS